MIKFINTKKVRIQPSEIFYCKFIIIFLIFVICLILIQNLVLMNFTCKINLYLFVNI
jgi:hypothetical protein